MEVALPIILLVLAFGFLLMEVFLPSLGLLTIVSAGCFLISAILGFDHSTTLGWTVVGCAVLGIPFFLILGFKVFPKTPMGKHLILSGPGRAPAPATRADRTDLLGREGLTTSRLRPSGIADFDGERFDAITRGELIEEGVRVRVIDIHGNRIVVRSLEDAEDTEEEEELR